MMAKLNGPIYLIKDDDLLKKMWEKVFKNEPSKFCGKQPLKNWKAEHLFNFFKSCLPQIPTWSILEYLFQYNDIWNKVSNSIEEELDYKPICNRNFLKTIISSYGGEGTYFHTKKNPKVGSNYIC